MLKLLRKIRCALTGHDLTVWQVLRPWSRRMICERCDGDWAYHVEHGAIPWTPECQAMYEGQGLKIRPTPAQRRIPG